MKTFLVIFILLFPTSVFAEDISDFQIEGMSVGDMYIDHFSEKTIKQNKKNWFKNNKYTIVTDLHKSSFQTYDWLQLVFKTIDTKKEIYGIEGIVIYDKNIKGCFKEMKNIITAISKLFENVNDLGEVTYAHAYDKSGESIETDRRFELDGDIILIGCQDWSKKSGFPDQLRVSIRKKDYSEFLKTAY